MYAHVCALQLEGIVAKQPGSAYVGEGRNGDWLKVKRRGAVSPEWLRR